MKSILLREIKGFFGSLVGYMVIVIFLIVNGLFLWVFEGNFNIPQSGFADLEPFFRLAPWVMIFLIPAVTMKSFSEELKQGTIEILLTKPLSVWHVVLGKFFAAVILIVIALIPTLIYVWVLAEYSLVNASMDIGSLAGSYMGLLFLAASYAAIGVFSSTLSENQIVSFLVAVILCLLFYLGMEEVAKLLGGGFSNIEKLGMQYHFKSIGRGVIDTRDLLYFVSLSILFLSLTVLKIKSIKI